MIIIEVNVSGTKEAEIQVLLAKKEIRNAIAGVCGLDNSNIGQVRLAFHSPQNDTPLDTLFILPNLVFEIIINNSEKVLFPRAEQLRDKLMADISQLHEYRVGISVPGQSRRNNCDYAVWVSQPSPI